MRRLRTHALGRVSWLDDGTLDAERLMVPLTDASGVTRAWCLALPFLRPAEVTGVGRACHDDEDTDRNDYVTGISRVHEQLIAAARQRRAPGQALVAMSHAHLHGAAVSEASERPIVIGGEESISAGLFPSDIAYVALGHLHRAQQVGEARIRYSGSPLPLDFSEVTYPHQVVEAVLEGESLTATEAIPVPRPVAMYRVGPGELATVLAELKALPDDPTQPRERWPWLEVRVELGAPVPDLRAQVEAVLEGKAVRLLRLERRLPQHAAEGRPERVDLQQLGPRKLFQRTWEKQWGEAPGAEVMADFDRLLQDVLDGEANETGRDTTPEGRP